MALILSLMLSIPAWAQKQIYSQAEYIMGTVFTVKIESAQPPTTWMDAVFEILRHYDRLLSDYRPDSERSRVLQQPAAQPTRLSQEFCRALVWSQYFSVLSEGAFDITVGPLVRLWGFRSGELQIPSAQALQERRQATGYQKIQVQNCRLTRSHDSVEMDFGAIGKGLAIDAAVSYLKQQGVTVAAIDGGQSTQYFLGAPAQSPQGWPVNIRGQETLFYLKNKALSSSGDDQQFFEHEAVRYSHILDPRTAFPLRNHGGVTVIADRAMSADAMSTALVVLGPEAAADYGRLLDVQIYLHRGEESSDSLSSQLSRAGAVVALQRRGRFGAGERE